LTPIRFTARRSDVHVVSGEWLAGTASHSLFSGLTIVNPGVGRIADATIQVRADRIVGIDVRGPAEPPPGKALQLTSYNALHSFRGSFWHSARVLLPSHGGGARS
jgi:hypothetical protein